MKNKKLIACLFVFSLVLGTANVLADSPYEVFSNISLPAFKGKYISNPHNKTEYGYQYAKTISSKYAIEMATKDSEGVESMWITPGNDYTKWSDTNANGNKETGSYYLQIKNKSNILAGNFTGTWVLNPSYAK